MSQCSRGRRRLGLVTCAALALAALLVSGLVLARGGAGDVLSAVRAVVFPREEQKMPLPEPPPTTRPSEVAIGEVYVVQGYEVTVHSIRVGRERGELPYADAKDMHLLRDESARMDADGTFLDDHRYIDVELTVKNVSNTEYDQFLATACSLYTNKKDAIGYGAEVYAGTIAPFDERLGHDSGKIPLAVGESASGHVGFVVTRQVLENTEAPLYFTVDISGSAWIKPEESGASWVKVPQEEE